MAVRIFNLQVRLPLVLLALTEGGLLLLAPHLVTWMGIGTFGDEVGTSSRPVLVGSVVFAALGIASLIAVGLYSTRQGTDLTGVAVRVAAGIAAAVVLSALVYYFLPGISIGRRTLFMAAAIGAVASLALRAAFERLFEDELFKRRVLVYGAGRRASTLLALRQRSDTRGFRLVAFMAAEGDESSALDERLTRRPPDLFRWAMEQQIDEIVVAMDDRRRDFPMVELLECRLAGIDVLELATFLERETGKVRLDVSNPSWIVLGEGFRESPRLQVIERIFDIVVSLVLLLPALPLMLVTAIAIRLEDGLRAPVFYQQSRVGRYNQPFKILKLRSMCQDAEEEGAVWALPRDPRITRVGAIIRKTRIDELPQLLNVLRGDMSFVGPRPERPEFVAELAKSLPYYRSRHAVKPGITGWAQLCYPYGASTSDALEKLQYDLFYVKHRSLILDLVIVLQTVEVVLWGKGAR
ncbi:MAG: TIGR03013 family PEP-CTERM/XrtA system glycosyltransferase [Gammaproteobacteria bacterium]|nr:TIGR03013 family PEP-CTERM/XrtA system glycosyltransferase [Gammaproteobacteria bacterium]